MAGLLAICPLVGTITSGPDTGTTIELTPTPVDVDLFGPVTTLNYVEGAATGHHHG